MNMAARYRTVGGAMRATGKLGWHRRKEEYPTKDIVDYHASIGRVVVYVIAKSASFWRCVVVWERRGNHRVCGGSRRLQRHLGTRRTPSHVPIGHTTETTSATPSTGRTATN